MKRSLMLAVAATMMLGAGAGHAAADTTPPTMTFTTAEDSILVSAPVDHDLTRVRGTAKDSGSGMSSVTVLYCTGYKTEGGGWVCNVAPLGHIQSVTAALSCSGATCTWRAAVPTRPGGYIVFAEGKDKAGNAKSIGPIEIVVV